MWLAFQNRGDKQQDVKKELIEALKRKREKIIARDFRLYPICDTISFKIFTAFLLKSGVIDLEENKLGIESGQDGEKLRDFLQASSLQELSKMFGKNSGKVVRCKRSITKPSPPMRSALRYAYEKARKGKYVKSTQIVKYSNPGCCSVLNSCFAALELCEDMYRDGKRYAYLLNSEKLKYVWPDIDSYPENYFKPRKEKEKSEKLGKRVREALTIMGYKSLEELKKEHKKNPERVIEKIKSLSSIDWRLHGYGNCRHIPQIKKRLLGYLNKP